MNLDQVLHLLKIMDLAKQWPQFQALHDIAREELVKVNAEAQESLAGLARDRAEAKAANEAKLREKANAEAEKQEQAQADTYKQAINSLNQRSASTEGEDILDRRL